MTDDFDCHLIEVYCFRKKTGEHIFGIGIQVIIFQTSTFYYYLAKNLFKHENCRYVDYF